MFLQRFCTIAKNQCRTTTATTRTRQREMNETSLDLQVGVEFIFNLAWDLKKKKMKIIKKRTKPCKFIFKTCSPVNTITLPPPPSVVNFILKPSLSPTQWPEYVYTAFGVTIIWSNRVVVVEPYHLHICCTHICITLASLSARWQLRAEPWSFICLDHVLSPPSFTPSQSTILDLRSSNMRVREQLQIYKPRRK